jgi:hypothetical protein
MNKRLIWVLSAALLSGVSVAAIASNHSMDKRHEHGSKNQRDGVKGAEAQLAKLELALKLDASQRPAWNAFAKDIKDLAQAREKQHEDMRATMKKAQDAKTMSATERMDAMGQMMQVQQAQLEKMKTATQTLMTQLSPAQQTVFNAEAGHWSARMGHASHPRGDKKGKGCQS